MLDIDSLDEYRTLVETNRQGQAVHSKKNLPQSPLHKNLPQPHFFYHTPHMDLPSLANKSN